VIVVVVDFFTASRPSTTGTTSTIRKLRVSILSIVLVVVLRRRFLHRQQTKDEHEHEHEHDRTILGKHRFGRSTTPLPITFQCADSGSGYDEFPPCPGCSDVIRVQRTRSFRIARHPGENSSMARRRRCYSAYLPAPDRR